MKPGLRRNDFQVVRSFPKYGFHAGLPGPHMSGAVQVFDVPVVYGQVRVVRFRVPPYERIVRVGINAVCPRAAGVSVGYCRLDMDKVQVFDIYGRAGFVRFQLWHVVAYGFHGSVSFLQCVV